MKETARGEPTPNMETTSGDSFSSEADCPHSTLHDIKSNAHKYGRLTSKGGNFGIPTNEGARDYVEKHDGEESWRMRVLELLHQSKVQYTLMGLLLLDVIILFIELFLMTQYPSCRNIERDCISCCPGNSNQSGLEEQVRFLAEDEYHEDICDEGHTPNLGTAGCDLHKWDRVHKAEVGFHWLTVFILSTFFVELHLEMVSLRPQVFFRQFFYALDYFIVVVSLVLELTLKNIDEGYLATLFGLLIFARIWRFIRIGHGIVEITSELTHEKYEELLEYAFELEEAAKAEKVELPSCPHSVAKALKKHASSLEHAHSSSMRDP